MEYPWSDERAGVDHPAMDSPRFDVTERQRGDVWFLASPFGAVQREVDIPRGVYLYIGMLNAESSNLEDPPFYGGTWEERAAGARGVANHIRDLFVEIDGVELDDPQSFRIATDDVKFFAPSPWLYGEAGGEGVSSGDGYFLMLRPLPPGPHTINYRGAFEFTAELDGFNAYYVIEMTYRLNVYE